MIKNDAYTRSDEHLDGDQVRVLRNPVSAGADRSSNVSSVANRIVVNEGKAEEGCVVALGGTAAKLDMLSINAAVDHVGIRASAGTVVEDVCLRARLAMGDTSQTPGCTRLRSHVPEIPDLILFHIIDLQGNS